jgi:hypothetical protein
MSWTLLIILIVAAWYGDEYFGLGYDRSIKDYSDPEGDW